MFWVAPFIDLQILAKIAFIWAKCTITYSRDHWNLTLRATTCDLACANAHLTGSHPLACPHVVLWAFELFVRNLLLKCDSQKQKSRMQLAKNAYHGWWLYLLNPLFWKSPCLLEHNAQTKPKPTNQSNMLSIVLLLDYIPQLWHTIAVLITFKLGHKFNCTRPSLSHSHPFPHVLGFDTTMQDSAPGSSLHHQIRESCVNKQNPHCHIMKHANMGKVNVWELPLSRPPY